MESEAPQGPVAETVPQDRPEDRPGPVVLAWVRPAAVLAFLATLVGRGLGPALPGSFPTAYRYEVATSAAAVLTQAASLCLASLLVFQTRAVLGRPRLPLVFRFAASSLAGVVLGLAVPAAVFPLPAALARILAVATAALALLVASRGIRVVATRALAIVATTLALGAALRQVAWGLALYAGEHALVGASVVARWIGSAALLVHAVATASALVWLATRKKRLFSPWTTLAMGVSVVLTHYAELGHRASSTTAYFVGRTAATMALPIHPMGPPALRVFLVTMSTFFALVAVCQRRQVAPLAGAFALALLGGVDAEMPLPALFTAAAALTMALVGEDKRSLWAAMEASTDTPRPMS